MVYNISSWLHSNKICYLILGGKQPGREFEGGRSDQSWQTAMMNTQRPQRLGDTHQLQERPWGSGRPVSASRDLYSDRRPRTMDSGGRPLSDLGAEDIDSWLSTSVIIADKLPLRSNALPLSDSPSNEAPPNWNMTNSVQRHRSYSETPVQHGSTTSRPASQVSSFYI